MKITDNAMEGSSNIVFTIWGEDGGSVANVIVHKRSEHVAMALRAALERLPLLEAEEETSV